MRSFFKTLALVIVLIGVSFGAQAGFGFKVGGADVDDITTTACTTARNQTVTSFGNGVSMNQVWELQREVGSPGSGQWELVSGHADIFPTTQGGAGTGGDTQVDRYTSEAVACFRLMMTTDTAGTAQVQIVTDRDTPSVYNSTVSYRIFEDFMGGVFPITTAGDSASWLSFKGNGTNAVNPVLEAQPEGVITLTSGSSNDDTDLVVGSYSLAGMRALVSDGLTVVEFRVHAAAITQAMGFGLSDTIANGTEMEPFEADGSNVISEGTVTSCADCIAFLAHATMTNTYGWLAVSLNTNTQGNVADEYTLLHPPVALTYQVLRIEVDSAGHGYWYINGDLVGAEPNALATTALVMPYFWAGSVTAALGKVNIDYIDFWAARPSG